MNEFYKVYREVLQAAGKHDEQERLASHIHEKRKPLSHTQTLIQSVGLDICSVYEDSFSIRYCDGSAMLNSPLIKLAFIEPWTSVLDPEDLSPVFEAIELELNHVAGAVGELRLTVPWVCIDIRKPDQ
jgi:hypothetical protein